GAALAGISSRLRLGGWHPQRAVETQGSASPSSAALEETALIVPSTQGKMSKVEAKTDKARARDDARGARLHLQNGLSSRPIGSALGFFRGNPPRRGLRRVE